MSIILLLAAQAAGREITTFYPLPPKQQQEEELRKAQGLPVAEQAPKTCDAAKAEKPETPKEQSDIEVVTVTKVSPNANVVFVPPPPDQPQ